MTWSVLPGSDILRTKTQLGSLMAVELGCDLGCSAPRQSLEMGPSAILLSNWALWDLRGPSLIIMFDECPFGKYVDVRTCFARKTIPTRRQTFRGHFVASKDTSVTYFLMTESNIYNVKTRTTYGAHFEDALLSLP